MIIKRVWIAKKINRYFNRVTSEWGGYFLFGFIPLFIYQKTPWR